jgi:membrane-associated phospholipid phosphatase
VDFRAFRAIDGFSRDHTWLAHAANGFETIGVVVYALAVAALWFAARPGGERAWKVAALGATVSAFAALLCNRVLAAIWDRPRPYESHPGVYHLSDSHDPSFPSDHASAAFAIAFAVYLVDRRIGRIFVGFAVLIAFGRLLIGAHYPGDVLAGLGVGALTAFVVVYLGRRLLERAVLLLERVSDPVVAPVHRLVRRDRAGSSG